MGNPAIIFPTPVPPGNVISATSQAGARPLSVEPADSNSGGFQLAAAGGSPGVVTDHLWELTVDGDLGAARARFSADGGENYLGHDAAWTDGVGGAAGSAVTLAASTTNVPFSGRAALDDGGAAQIPYHLGTGTTGSGVRIIGGQVRDGSTAISTLSTWQSFPSGSFRPVYVQRGTERFSFTVISATEIAVSKLAPPPPRTVGFGSYVKIASITTSSCAGVDAFAAIGGKLVMVYSSNNRIKTRSSSNGVTWSAEQEIVGGASARTLPTVVQTKAGVTFGYWVLDGTGIQSFKSTATDPGTGSWASNTITGWTASTNDTSPSACVDDKDVVHVVFIDSSAYNVKHTYGDGTAMSADADVYNGDSAHAPSTPNVACINGQLWCTYTRNDLFDIMASFLRTFVAYDEGVNDIVIGTGPIGVPGGMVDTFTGAGGKIGDSWTIATVYDFPASRLFGGYSSRPARSTEDVTDWVSVADAGENSVFPATAVALKANVPQGYVQMNQTDSWGSPSGGTALTLTEETHVAANITNNGDGTITVAGASWVDMDHKGKHVLFAGGAVYEVVANGSDWMSLYSEIEDVTAETGDMQLLAGRAWSEITASRRRFARVRLVGAETLDGYYEALACIGRLFDLGIGAACEQGIMEEHDEHEDVGASAWSQPEGEALRLFTLSIVNPSLAARTRLEAEFRAIHFGAVPFCLIPDMDDPHDFAMVTCVGKGARWDTETLVFELREV